MTKEQNRLYTIVRENSTFGTGEQGNIILALNKFFESNVYIPKEDIEHLRWIYNRLVYMHFENCNYDYMRKFNSIISAVEPVYEWQWVENGIVQSFGFYTEHEVDSHNYKMVRIEETKRIRQ